MREVWVRLQAIDAYGFDSNVSTTLSYHVFCSSAHEYHPTSVTQPTTQHAWLKNSFKIARAQFETLVLKSNKTGSIQKCHLYTVYYKYEDKFPFTFC